MEIMKRHIDYREVFNNECARIVDLVSTVNSHCFDSQSFINLPGLAWALAIDELSKMKRS